MVMRPKIGADKMGKRSEEKRERRRNIK